MSDTKLLKDIDDLIKQATTERSHYYTAEILRRAKVEIERLREIEWVMEGS